LQAISDAGETIPVESDSDRLAWMLQVKAMRQLYEQKSQHHWQTLIADNKGDT